MLADSPSLRQRMREQTRREVVVAATGLFVERGYENTTVDEICAVVGMSRRSFFRYFEGKEGIVVSQLDDLAVAGSAAFEDSPTGEDVWSTLRRCMDPFVAWSEENPGRAMEIIRLVEETPALRAAYLARVDEWRANLAELISEKLRLDAQHGLYAAVVAAAGMGAFIAGGRAWQVDRGTTHLAVVFDRAFAALNLNPVRGKQSKARSENARPERDSSATRP